MTRNYMTYPLKYMRITQNYLGTVSHLKHTTGTPKDYPIDDGGKDTGRDPIYCPCDEMVVTAVKGYGNSKVTNTIWLVSTSFVVTPTFEDYAFMTLTHSNDSDLKNIKVGDTFKRGDIICYEGTDGATSNHVHLVAGRGKSSGWVQSTSGSWVISGDTKKPEEVFFVDLDFTQVLSYGGLTFLKVPKNVGVSTTRNSNVNQLEVLVDNLNARTEASLSAPSLGYVIPGIYNYQETTYADDYTWYHIDQFWIAYDKNWIQLYPKEEIPLLDEETKPENPPITPPEDSYRFIFESKESKYYKIFLKENAKLYLKDS